jgi:hypothetical protein
MRENMIRLPCAFNNSAANVAPASRLLEYFSALQRGK